jgi:hypothetical protein
MRGIFPKTKKQEEAMYLELLEWTEIFVATPLHTYAPT